MPNPDAPARRHVSLVALIAVLVFGLAVGFLGYRLGFNAGLASLNNPPQAAAAQVTLAAARELPDLTPGPDGWIAVEHLTLAALRGDELVAEHTLDAIDTHWRPGYAPMLIELARFSPSQSRRNATLAVSAKRFGLSASAPLDDHWAAVWATEFEPHPDYAAFKAQLYDAIDPTFASYFDDTPAHTIRLDEVRWGGVRRDGIPPLVDPSMVAASHPDAAYLDDTNVVFGVVIDGDARAYPKRILAWHEMFRDTIGGRRIVGVYCTLCGTVIAYDAAHHGTTYELGTSGFLYRSNKLMYDPDTFSMWSTFGGTPVIGPLVGQGIALDVHPVVTTTWGRWKADHPDTTVLTLDTGHRRDYGEGVAYRDYFATHDLMFTIPDELANDRLANKAEVFVLRSNDEDVQPLAIAADRLADETVFEVDHAGRRIIVLTDPSGANRAYEAADLAFTAYDPAAKTATDTTGRAWTVTENALISKDSPNATALPRTAGHRAFWFGFHAAFPDAPLID
ncbi:MAG: DUF3179 domain-containing (seleno)protein [Planctomycetota bacterium]